MRHRMGMVAMSKPHDAVTAAYLVPGLPHILLATERCSQWQELNRAYAEVRHDIATSDANVILYFSTQWFSVLGTMVQGSARLQGRHVEIGRASCRERVSPYV